MIVVNKRAVRCFRGFASFPSLANVEVFYTVPDFGYDHRLFTCIECGALFVREGDQQGATTAGLPCPQCRRDLGSTLRAYPATFRHIDGRVGHYEPSHAIPADSESIVREFFDLAAR